MAADCGFQLKMKTGDRMDVPMDFRFLDMLLRPADEHSQGVWVGPGTRMPRLRALCKPKRKLRLGLLANGITDSSSRRLEVSAQVAVLEYLAGRLSKLGEKRSALFKG